MLDCLILSRSGEKRGDFVTMVDKDAGCGDGGGEAMENFFDATIPPVSLVESIFIVIKSDSPSTVLLSTSSPFFSVMFSRHAKDGLSLAE